MNETMGSYEVTHEYRFRLSKTGVSNMYYFRLLFKKDYLGAI